MKASQPIGIFDSGIGGLTVANAIRKVLPNERIIYFGDTAHMPYGDKSPEAIKYYSLKIGQFLKMQGCKVIVIACNTASSLGFNDLKEFMADEVPVFNVIDPVIAFTANNESYRKVGVIATKATIRSNVYEKKLKEHNPNLQVHSLATPLLAPMIEEGFFDDSISETVINSYLSSPKLKNIDALILACTHYPLIKQEIESFFNNKVDILNTASIVADNIKKQLEMMDMLNTQQTEGKDEFYVSDLTPSFESSTRIFFGNKISLIQKNIWEK